MMGFARAQPILRVSTAALVGAEKPSGRMLSEQPNASAMNYRYEDELLDRSREMTNGRRPVLSHRHHRRSGAAGRFGGATLCHAPSIVRDRATRCYAARRPLRGRAIHYRVVRASLAVGRAGRGAAERQKCL